jgi:hypothetical protein
MLIYLCGFKVEYMLFTYMLCLLHTGSSVIDKNLRLVLVSLTVLYLTTLIMQFDHVKAFFKLLSYSGGKIVTLLSSQIM